MKQIPDDPILRSMLRCGYPPWMEQDRRSGRAAKPGRSGGRPCPAGACTGGEAPGRGAGDCEGARRH